MALIALMEIRVRVAEVTNRELSASSAALVLARVGERLPDRTPALMAANGADARQHQTNPEQVALARDAYDRTLDRLTELIPAIPAGLRTGLQGALTRLAGQLGPDGIFALRHNELTTLDDADRLVAASRAIATDLKQRVDALVRAANENIARAANAKGANLLNNTLWFVAVSVAVVLLATLLSYRFVVRVISLNLRSGWPPGSAMRRCRPRSGNLARAFNWRRA